MTAQAIGSLFVALGLDSAAFQAGVKQVQNQAQEFGGKLGKAMGAAVAAAVPALTAIGVAAANNAAEIKRAAQVANSTPLEFQQWVAGAKSAGIEQEKLADILKDVNDRVGDFVATGGGPMVDFFERIAPKVGVTVDQFRNLSGPKALQLYVDSLEKANLNQQDMTFFLEAMASDATALLPLLRDGGKGMAEYAAKAQALGVIMDDKTVASFARAKQSLSDVQMAFAGFRTIIAQQVVPVLAKAADAFVEAAKEGNWLGDLVRGLAEILPRLTAYVTTFIGFMGVKWVAAFAAARIATMTLAGALATLKGALMRTGIGLIVVAVGELVYQVSRWIDAVGGMGAAFNVLKAEFLAVLRQMAGGWVEFTWMIAEGMNSLFGTNLSGADATITQNLAQMEKAARDAAAAAKSVGAESAGAAGGLQAFGSGLDAAGASGGKLSDLERVMKSLREEAEKLAATMNMSDLESEIWGKQREAGVSSSSAQGKQIAGMVTMIDGMKELKSATEEWRDTIQSAFQEFILQGGSFKKVLSQIIGKLAEMMFTTGFKNLWAGIGGNGLIGGILGGLGIGSNGTASIGTNANGTNYWRGGLSMVNERGGEIMNLPRGTQVIPHDISKRMADNASRGGGRVVTVIAQHDPGIIMRVIDGRIGAAAPGIMAGAVQAARTDAQENPWP